MSMLLKAIYTFNATLSKYQWHFSQTETNDPKISLKQKRPWIAKAISRNKS